MPWPAANGPDRLSLLVNQAKKRMWRSYILSGGYQSAPPLGVLSKSRTVVFGWNRQKAEVHMLQVHRQGKSLLARTTMEKAEHYVHQLQKYTLHATMERES